MSRDPEFSFLREAGAAALGGSLHALIEQPLVTPVEASITQTQINGKNFVYNFKDLMAKKMLYRALPTALVGAVPKAIIHYSILTAYANAFAEQGDMQKATGKQALLIGAAVGATECVMTNPINFVKFRMQRPEWGYNGMMDAIRTIARVEGVAAFWKGTQFVFMRNTICNGGMTGGYKLMDNLFEEHFSHVHAGTRHFLAGSIGGLIGSFVSYPFEMMRAARQHNVSFFEEIASKGPKRLLAGWTPGACRLVLTSAIMGSIIPKLKGFSRALVGVDEKKE